MPSNFLWSDFIIYWLFINLQCVDSVGYKSQALKFWNFFFNKWIQIVISCATLAVTHDSLLLEALTVPYTVTQHTSDPLATRLLQPVEGTRTPVLAPIRFLPAKHAQALELHPACHPAALYFRTHSWQVHDAEATSQIGVISQNNPNQLV